jgi:hypothetical protein
VAEALALACSAPWSIRVVTDPILNLVLLKHLAAAAVVAAALTLRLATQVELVARAVAADAVGQIATQTLTLLIRTFVQVVLVQQAKDMPEGKHISCLLRAEVAQVNPAKMLVPQKLLVLVETGCR